MPAKLDRCVKKVEPQQRKKGRGRKNARSAAFAICTASLKRAKKKK